jgi:hypothetical protein
MFNKNHMATLVAATGLFFVSTAANAITLTLDEYSKTVLQPASGFVQVDFTGTVTLTEGYEGGYGASSSIWNAAGDIAYGTYGNPTGNYTGVIFSLLIDATDLGLYAFDHTLLRLAYFTTSECPTVGGICNNATVNYSVNVVKPVTSVPEPASFTLLGASLLGLAFSTRRSRRACEATGAV